MKSKWLFFAGIIMWPGIVGYILVCSAFSDPRDLWPPFEMFWIILYLWTAVTLLAFILFSAFKLYDLIKNANGLRMNSLAGIFGGIGCALFTFAGCFAWYVVNHPQMDVLFGDATYMVYNAYIIITLLLLISAIVLKFISGYTKISEYINERKTRNISE